MAKGEAVDKEAISAIADDSLSIFRACLFLIVVYLTILSLVFREGGSDLVIHITDSFYTINGIMFWMGSTVMSVVAYRFSRRNTLKEEYAEIGAIASKHQIMNTITAAIVGLLIAVFSLIFGLLEGWSNSVSDPGRIPISEVGLIVIIAFILVLMIFSILSVLDIIRERRGPIRKLLP